MSNKITATVQVIQDGVEHHVIGMTEEEAIRTLTLNGINMNDIRVMNPNMIYSLEFNSDRINLVIEHNKVVRATRG